MAHVLVIDMAESPPLGRWHFENAQSVRRMGEVAMCREHIVYMAPAREESGSRESGELPDRDLSILLIDLEEIGRERETKRGFGTSSREFPAVNATEWRLLAGNPIEWIHRIYMAKGEMYGLRSVTWGIVESRGPGA